MGARGPVPKRSSERRRRNKESKPDKVPAKGAAAVKRPRASAHWHPIAKSWFTSLEKSGQSTFYEPSDWQAARFVAELISRQLKDKKPNAGLFAAVWAAMNDLMTTEASRRRLRVEIEREAKGDDEPAVVTALDDYRRGLAT